MNKEEILKLMFDAYREARADPLTPFQNIEYVYFALLKAGVIASSEPPPQDVQEEPAVNSHEALAEALKKLKANLEDTGGLEDIEDRGVMLEIVEQALNAAGKK
jgi:hypothetical protein